LMSEAADKFIERVDRLEARYRGDKYADVVMMPLDLLVALRDELKAERMDDMPLFAAVAVKTDTHCK
jgi:hypothetical protein